MNFYNHYMDFSIPELIEAYEFFTHKQDYEGCALIAAAFDSKTVVQQVMGHASMQVTLGYLRNLEVPVLKVEDMPA